MECRPRSSSGAESAEEQVVGSCCPDCGWLTLRPVEEERLARRVNPKPFVALPLDPVYRDVSRPSSLSKREVTSVALNSPENQLK